MSNSINLTRRLDWADTDAAGYWHHSTFWKYAEAGEAELVRAAGLTDIVFGHSPRRSVAAEFIRPIYFDDEVTIDCTVEHLGRTSLTYAITLSVGDEIAATGTMSVVLVDVDGRPTPWPDEVRRALG